MRKIKKFLKILFSKNGLTSGQIFNIFLFQISPKRQILNYDPLTLLIYVTDRCNFRCQFCPHHSQLAKEKYSYFHEPTLDFTLENFKKILDLFPNTIMITFSGVGEPLLNKEIFDMADYAAQKNIYSQIITNGVLLDPEKIKRILANPYFYSVSISLNAINPSQYTKSFDGRGELFEKVISNIKNLITEKQKAKHPLEVVVSFVIHKENFFQIKDFIDFAQNLGADCVDFLNLIDFGIPGFGMEKQLYETDQKIKEYFSSLKSSLKEARIEVNLPILFSNRIKKKCKWFFKNLSIDGAGNVGGCGRVMNPTSKNGNVFKEGKKVWNNEYFQRMRKIFLKKEAPLPKCCQNCVENQC